MLYSAARKQVMNRRYEPVSQSPWYVYTDAKGVLHQVWYDDEQSLGKKIDYIVDQQLGGVGLWALGYEDVSFWTLISDKLLLSAPPVPASSLPPLPPASPESPQIEDLPPSLAEAQGCSLGASSRTSARNALMPLGLLLLGVWWRRRLRYN